MRNKLCSLVLALALGVSTGCAVKTPTSINGLTAAEISTQTAGVAVALENLPKAPDEAVQSQIEGYAKWAVFLAKAASIMLGVL